MLSESDMVSTENHMFVAALSDHTITLRAVHTYRTAPTRLRVSVLHAWAHTKYPNHILAAGAATTRSCSMPRRRSSAARTATAPLSTASS